MHHKKCGGKVRVDQTYTGDNYMNLACIICGQNWDLDLHSTGNGGVLGRYLYKKMSGVNNGV